MAPLVPEASIMKSRTVVTSTRDSEPSPAAIIGGILALGVVRAMKRANRSSQPAECALAEVGALSPPDHVNSPLVAQGPDFQSTQPRQQW
jgi:hypothetical protein